MPDISPYIMRLLANKDFNFEPFWEEAMTTWIKNNTPKLLDANPHCAKVFIGDSSMTVSVAKNLVLEDGDVSQFIRTLSDGDEHEYKIIAERLVDAKKADLLASCKLTNFIGLDDDEDSEFGPNKIVSAMSPQTIESLIKKIDWAQCKWPATALTTFIEKAPVERLHEIEIHKHPGNRIWRNRRWETTYQEKRRTMVVLASKLPKDHIQAFLANIMPGMSTMDCCSCGDFTAKSMPGYTLHRKVCDPNNKYPNALFAAAHRLV